MQILQQNAGLTSRWIVQAQQDTISVKNPMSGTYFKVTLYPSSTTNSDFLFCGQYRRSVQEGAPISLVWISGIHSEHGKIVMYSIECQSSASHVKFVLPILHSSLTSSPLTRITFVISRGSNPPTQRQKFDYGDHISTTSLFPIRIMVVP